MIQHPAFPVEPWALRETELDLDMLAQTESVFALSNGHIGLRGNLDEGEPHGLPGTYLNGFYEMRPLPYAEAGYGFPESGQTIINVTNGKLIRLLVDDEPFDVRYGELRSHERVLDFRAGVLHRDAPSGNRPPGARSGCPRPGWCRSPSGRSAAICYEVEPLDDPAPVVVQSELVANEQLPRAERRPPGRGRAGGAAAVASTTTPTARRGAGSLAPRQRAAHCRGHGSHDRRARRHRGDVRGVRATWRGVDRDRRRSSPGSRCG